ncbi:helix-turn-helix domain-containing protein [Comamonas nitrativorans]|uniref:Helix-turn-helix domain-containing protein n=1 Tax=Comamonas nitrativorans TaxID=108437 RepID=A0ABV9GUY8_9BURK
MALTSPSEERSPVLVAFGRTVRHLRKAQGFSQEAFADECGIDRSYMGGVERGERNIALINIAKIISGLGMQPSEFFQALDAAQGQPPGAQPHTHLRQR